MTQIYITPIFFYFTAGIEREGEGRRLILIREMYYILSKKIEVVPMAGKSSIESPLPRAVIPSTSLIFAYSPYTPRFQNVVARFEIFRTFRDRSTREL